jgi:hypothetical protein
VHFHHRIQLKDNFKNVEEEMPMTSLRWSFLINASFKWAFKEVWNGVI